MAGSPQQPQQFPAHRYVIFVGALNPPATTTLRQQLVNLLYQSPTKVTLLFSSTGGNTDEAIALHTFLKALPYELTIHAIAAVSSAAIPVFLSVDKSHRLASRNARFMFHDYVWNFAQNGPMDRSLISGLDKILNDAIAWTKEVVKSATNLQDADFETMKLFQQPVIIDANQAVNIGMVQTIAEPVIPANSQPWVIA
jgi:ATP-dependent protease ClpP protease subunit